MTEALVSTVSNSQPHLTSYGSGSASISVSTSAISPSRRMFCLLALFDCLFTFVMWVIYSKSYSVPDLKKALQNQVNNFHFKSSLFDLVLLSVWRMVLLLIAYGLFRSSKVYMIASTTFVTTLLIVIKVFYYEWNGSKTTHPMDYFIFIFSFLICWGETWHLDFKVLPAEAKIQQRLLQESLPHFGSYGAFNDERNPFLNHRSTAAWLSDQASSYYASPHGTPPDSDTESEFQSVGGSRHGSRNKDQHLSLKDQALLKKARENFQFTLDLLSMHDGWKLEKNKDGVTVESRDIAHIGKMFRAKTQVNVSPDTLIDRVMSDLNSQSKWNPSVTELKILYTIDQYTDICYSVAAEAGGGLVSSRDFVNLRYWQRKGSFYISSSAAVQFDGMPPTKNHVRGENGPGGWIVQDVPGESMKADFIWFLNTDLKGWLPQYVIDSALSGVLVDTTKALKHYAEHL